MERASEINLKVLKLVHHKLLISFLIKTKEFCISLLSYLELHKIYRFSATQLLIKGFCYRLIVQQARV